MHINLLVRRGLQRTATQCSNSYRRLGSLKAGREHRRRRSSVRRA